MDNKEKEKENIILEIKFDGIDKSIPFNSFEALDDFTSHFENKKELIKALFPNEVKKPEVFRIRYKYKKRNEEKTKIYYPNIKYKNDNFDEEDLKKQFLNFIKLHPDKALDKYWGLFYIIDNIRIKNSIDGYLSVNEVEYAVEYLFNKGYKAKRDIYFKLKDLGIEIKTKEKEIEYKQKQNKYKNRIQEFEMRDDYQEYLQSLSLKGEQEEEYATEELSLYDIDKMPRKNTNGSNIPLFDGAEVVDIFPGDNIDEIVEKTKKLSKKNREKIIELLMFFRDGKNDGKKKCKK